MRAVSIFLLVLILTCRGASADLMMGLTQATPSQATLNIFQPDGVMPDILAFEPDGIVLSDRIEFRYPASLDFQSKQLPANWTFQSAIVNEGVGQIGVTTFYFTGADAGNLNEFYNFDQPWLSSFSLSDPGGGGPADVSLQVDVYGVSGLFGFRKTQVFTVSTVPEPRAVVLQLILGCFLLVSRRRGKSR